MPVSPGRYSPSQKYIEQVLVGQRFTEVRIGSGLLTDLLNEFVIRNIQQHRKHHDV
jgi:hypothetical protein